MEQLITCLPDFIPEIKKIIYSYFLLRLHYEEEFKLLAYMNNSLAFHELDIHHILPKIWHRTSNKFKFYPLDNHSYGFEMTRYNSWLCDLYIGTNSKNYSEKLAITDVFTRIMHTTCSIVGNDNFRSLRFELIGPNKISMEGLSNDRTIYALVKMEDFFSYEKTQSGRDLKFGLAVYDIENIFRQKRYEKIIFNIMNTRFITPDSDFTGIFLNSSIPEKLRIPSVVFDTSINIDIKLIIDMHKRSSDDDELFISTNDDELNIGIGDIKHTYSICKEKVPSNVVNIKYDHKWIEHIIPLENVISKCVLYIKNDFPMCMRLNFHHLNENNKMNLFICSKQ
jgi:hypothetical protein